MPARATILVGHGAPPLGFPPEKLARLKALERERVRRGLATMSDEERALDQEVRRWPRDASTDPYQAGLLRLADTLRRALATGPGREEAPLLVAYNEFCAPSLEEAVEHAVAQGAREIRVVPTMLVPGGVHSEREVPEAIAALSRAHPGVTISYAWPFDLDAVAALLADRVRGLGGLGTLDR
jgi:sirohydrochlorin cobaltochelatase